jgi:Phage integrase, N-terminal SAM-like domain
MRDIPGQVEGQEAERGPFRPPQLLTARELSVAIGVTPSWVYTRTKKGAIDPLPVVRLGRRGIRFDPYKISTYIRARERYRPDATLESSDGIARVSGKEKFKLTRKRLQTGSVRLREDGDPAWWEGFYRENVVNEAGKKERKRRAVNLGSIKDIRSEKAARQKLAVILEPINDAKHRPKKMMTFRGFITKYRALKLANQKGTTVHGYESNIRAHYLPEFGDMQLSEISIEAVQAFLNQKRLEGKAVQTLRNLKWGLSSIFESAIKYGYITSNPAPAADLPRRKSGSRKNSRPAANSSS